MKGRDSDRHTDRRKARLTLLYKVANGQDRISRHITADSLKEFPNIILQEKH